jgi:RNA polymerase sigma-70 factor (ECF subfamily)
MSENTNPSVPTRRSLLSRLKRWDDQASWQEFFDTYWKLIYGFAIRAGLAETEAQDVVQDTIVSVARQMPNFRYDSARGSFKSWLFLIARRRITDHLRKDYRRVKTEEPTPDETSRTALLERIPDPSGPGLDAIWDEEWKRHLFQAALRRVKGRVEPLHFQIFDCYALKDWPVKEVASRFHVNAGQVYVIKHRVSSLIAKEIEKLQNEPLG